MNANISERVKQRYLLTILEKEQTTGMHLLKLFQEKANPNSYNIRFEDFINSITRLSPSVTEEESSAVFHDYQQLGQETVDYRLLTTELDAIRQKHQVLTDILNQIIKQVQLKGFTLFDKFQSLDENNCGFLPKKVFLDVFALFNLHYEESSIQDIFCLLDSKEDHYSYRDFQEHFIKFLENDCKPMATHIVKASISQGRSLFEVLANNSDSGYNIKSGDFTNILTNLGPISQKDIDFLLACLSINLTSENEININEFCSALQVFCERLSIVSDEEIQQVFSCSKESKDLAKPQNSKITVSPVEMQKIQNMLVDIANFMKIDKISFDQLFGKRDYNKDGTITGHEFKKALCDDLFISYNPKVGLLIDYVQNQQGNIDLEVLKNQLELGIDTIVPAQSKIDPLQGLADEKVEKMFSEIVNFMKVDKITFEQLFSKKDQNKDGKLTEKEFKTALLEDLYISENPTLDLLINTIKNDQGDIDLITLKNRLGPDINAIEPAQNVGATDVIKTQQVEKMLGEIVKFMKDMNISFDQLFTVRDHDKTGMITEEDFKAALFEDLFIAENPTLCVLIESLRNDQGKIELLTLKNSLYED